MAAKVWNTLPIATFTDIGGKGGFLYVGQEYDATTGLQYSRARYYDPVSSEFISQDPLGFAGGDTNLYRRAGNSPANATDPSGMIVETGWDAFSLGVGLVSLGYNLRYGTWKDVGYDVLGIVADVGATLLPGVPGGAGVAIRATRLGAQAADAVAASATLQRSIKAVQLANLGANTIQGVESGVNAYDAYQDGRYTEAVFNGIGAGFAGLHLGTSAAGSAGRAARAFGGGFSAGFSETLGRQGSRLYSAGGAAASGIEATANGLRRGVQDLGPTGRGLPIVDSRFTPDIDKLDFGKHLRLNRGGPGAMPSPHAHHILFKKGLGPAQQRLVSEGQEILSRHEIDPIGGLENLVWAPMRVKGQHGIAALQNVVDTLKQVDSFGGSRDDIVDALRQLGEQAARRR
ncbi:MAG: RHS repeat-associated core domain-containing protein [Planctomycetia bacterium]